MRVNHGVEPIKSTPGMARGGSRPKPPKAVAQRASREATRAMPDHNKAKRRLTGKTVAFSALLTLWLSMIIAVGLASRPACSRHCTYSA
jgi:hypothetical protein